jgi:hypothetical protein
MITKMAIDTTLHPSDEVSPRAAARILLQGFDARPVPEASLDSKPAEIGGIDDLIAV